jgi:hypothetical protein
MDKALSRIEQRFGGHTDLLAQATALRRALHRPDADGEALRECLEDLAAELQGLAAPLPVGCGQRPGGHAA